MLNIEQKQIISNLLRTVKDWPKPNITFYDITPILLNQQVMSIIIDNLTARYRNEHLDLIVGIDARGFIFGPILAYQLGIGFVPVRKLGKLPCTTIAQNYSLEYNQNQTLEMHCDAIKPQQRVVILDDVIATGGTMLATCKLVQQLHGIVVECATVTDLPGVGGSNLLKEHNFAVYSLMEK